MRGTVLPSTFTVVLLGIGVAPRADAQISGLATAVARAEQETLSARAQESARRASQLEQAGDTAAAVGQYQAVASAAEALMRDEDQSQAPPTPNSAILLGTALLDVGRLRAASGGGREATDAFDGAERALQEALRRARANRSAPIQYRVLLDSRPTIFTALGEANFYQGNYAVARGYYQEALRLNPKSVRARDGLGYVDVLDGTRTPGQVRSGGTLVPKWMSDFLASEQGKTAAKAGAGMIVGRIFGPYGAIATPILLYAAEQLSKANASTPATR